MPKPSRAKQIIKQITLASIVVGALYFCITASAESRSVFMKTAGGLGIFLFGMTQMTEALERVAGDRIKRIFATLTGNRFTAMLSGVMVTALIQSSSATTVMVVGFVNSAVMNLTQAAGIIMGANIGTTVTGQLIAFKISHYAHLFIAVGVAMKMSAKRKSVRTTGQAIAGFGLIFLGLDVMKDVVAPLKASPDVKVWIAAISSNLFMAVLAGTIITVILQSSSATVAITMAMAGAGLIDLMTSVGIILGDNIGTTVTAQIASLAAKRNARRAATIHTAFNVIGVVLAMLLFPIFISAVKLISPAASGIERAIANSHTLFNIVNTAIFLPFLGLLTKLSYLIIPKNEQEIQLETTFLDKRLLLIPSTAIDAARRETLKLSGLVRQSLTEISALLACFDYSLCERIAERERVIDTIEGEIVRYLTLIEEKDVGKTDSEAIVGLVHLSHELERIGDQCDNISKIAVDLSERGITFSETAENELDEIKNLVLAMFDEASSAFDLLDRERARKVTVLEDRVNALTRQGRKSHVDRITTGRCDQASGYFFLDILEKLERIGDHCQNWAELVLEAN